MLLPLLPLLHPPRALQAYLFDTQGFMKIERALSADEVARLNATFDQYEDTMNPSPNYNEGSTAAR